MRRGCWLRHGLLSRLAERFLAMPPRSPDFLRKQLLELIRFVGVGGFTTLLYFALLWLAAQLLVQPMWVLAYAPALGVAYVLHRSFTFRSQKEHVSAGPRFLIVQVAGLVINSGIIWIGADVMRLPFVLVQLAAIGIQVLLTYLGQKFFAFA
jgi:putative flippase GtrA